jgi:uncharacterized membrane protein YedE/YeeE
MWWDSLNNLQQISFVLATTATTIMIIFIIMMLIGMDGSESFDGGVDVDLDANFDTDISISDADAAVDVYNNDSIISVSGLRILTIRGVLAFFSIGGWVIYAMAADSKAWVAILVGIICGLIAAVILAYAMKSAMKLERNGNLDYRSAVGKTAVVYIRVPKNSVGRGKVIFNHQGRMVEVDAITKQDEDIIAKREVRIVGLEDPTTLIVKKIEENKEN